MTTEINYDEAVCVFMTEISRLRETLKSQERSFDKFISAYKAGHVRSLRLSDSGVVQVWYSRKELEKDTKELRGKEKLKP